MKRKNQHSHRHRLKPHRNNKKYAQSDSNYHSHYNNSHRYHHLQNRRAAKRKIQIFALPFPNHKYRTIRKIISL